MTGETKVGKAHELDSPIPRAREERVLGDRVPGNRKSFALVLVEVHDGKVVDSHIEEFNGAITTCHGELVLVDFGPGQVVQRIVRIEPTMSPVRQLSWSGGLFYTNMNAPTPSLPERRPRSSPSKRDGHCLRCRSWPRRRPRAASRSRESTSLRMG